MPFTPGGGETGEQIYRRACAPCHGADGRGNGPDAAALRVPPADLTMLTARAGGTFPRTYVIETITGARRVREHGAGEMPVWPDRFEPSGQGATAVASLYAQQRTAALADYVETLQRR
jgi:mono/diheme cytochrome c family protein